MQTAFPRAAEDPVRWRIPFGHHPPFSAGPQHHNTRGMGPVIDLFERSGVRVSFSGHEHNFQHSHWKGIDYFVSGAGRRYAAASRTTSAERTRRRGPANVIFFWRQSTAIA